jgi:hypothetical protein
VTKFLSLSSCCARNNKQEKEFAINITSRCCIINLATCSNHRGSSCTQFLIWILYYWPEDDPVKLKHVAKLKTQHLIFVLMAIFLLWKNFITTTISTPSQFCYTEISFCVCVCVCIYIYIYIYIYITEPNFNGWLGTLALFVSTNGWLWNILKKHSERKRIQFNILQKWRVKETNKCVDWTKNKHYICYIKVVLLYDRWPIHIH